MTSNYSFVNGSIMKAQDACLPITDRGFRFGDGVFETIRLIYGVPYLWDYHIERLTEGLSALKIAAPLFDIKSALKQVIERNHAVDGTIRIAVSRGSGSIGYLPHNPSTSLVVEFIPLSAEKIEPATLCLSTYRRLSPQYFPSNYKLAQGVASTLALIQAREEGFSNAVLLSSDGFISECANANIFWIKNNIIYTPSLATGCIAGVMRRRTIELSPHPVIEVEGPIQAISDADSLILSNTRMGLCYAEKFQDTTYTPHPIFDALISAIAQDYHTYNATHCADWVMQDNA